MGLRWFLVVVSLLLAALACGAGPPATELASLELVTIRSGGRERTFFLGIPDDLGSGPHPLVITVHGGAKVDHEKGRTMAQVWRDHLDRDVIHAFPNSLYESRRPWFGPEDATPLRDVRFMADLVDEVARRHDIDRQRVYLSGFSAGAGFAWWVQCNDPERYAGFAMVSAMMAKQVMARCRPSVQRPVVYLHGDADTVVPIDGNAEHEPWSVTRDWLVARNRCSPRPTERTVRGRSVVARGQAFACTEVPSIEVWTIEGGGHCWPTRRGRCGGLDGSGLVLDYWRP